MSEISGLARSTIYRGLSDIRDNVSAPPGRIRKEGGGRKRKTIEDPTLVVDLKSLVAPATRGDPMRPLLWTSRSLRNLVTELAKKGHPGRRIQLTKTAAAWLEVAVQTAINDQGKSGVVARLGNLRTPSEGHQGGNGTRGRAPIVRMK
jgi:hypothetical protein